MPIKLTLNIHRIPQAILDIIHQRAGRDWDSNRYSRSNKGIGKRDMAFQVGNAILREEGRRCPIWNAK